MKKLMSISLSLISLNAFSFTREFRCDFADQNGNAVTVEAVRDFPGSVFRTLELRTDEEFFRYNAQTRTVRGFNTLEYWAGSTRLEIDLFPDRVPQWGRWYRSTFTSPDLNEGHRFRDIECQFINF